LDLDKDKEEDKGIEFKEDEIDFTQFGDLVLGVITCEVQERAAKKWDMIASDMWRDYTAFLKAKM
jgi:hypothetical protein